MKKQSNLNIKEIEGKIGYSFRDTSLLTQAFTRTSYCNEHMGNGGIRLQSNEVLEFFGDGVLSVAIISFMLKESTERYEYGIRTDLNEGDFSNLKSKLSDKQNLSRSMKALGLEKYLRMGEGDEKLGIQNEPSVMEDLFESIVGAVYIDSGMSIDAVIFAVSHMLDMSAYTSKEKPTQSSKNALQEWCADKKRRLPAPRYATLSEDGPDHKKTYVRACYIGDRLVGRGVGKNFKIADAAAADDALQALMAEESRNTKTNVVNSSSNQEKTVHKESPAKKNTTANTAVKGSAASKQSHTAKDANADSKDTAQSAVSHGTRLKAYISSMKLPSARYRDLGDSLTDGKKESKVECILGDRSVIGTGETRPKARENANALMLEALGVGKKKKTESKGSAEKAEKKAKAVSSAVKSPNIAAKSLQKTAAKAGKAPEATAKTAQTSKLEAQKEAVASSAKATEKQSNEKKKPVARKKPYMRKKKKTSLAK